MRIKTTKTARKAAVQFVMSSPELTLCPGLFRHISSADQDDYLVALDLTYVHGETKLVITGTRMLSGFDLAVLQALELAAAGMDEQITAAAGGVRAELRTQLAVPGHEDAPDGDLSYATCSVSQLLKLVGLQVNAEYTDRVYESLKRLMGVTLFVSDVNKPRKTEAFHLLSHVVYKDVARNGAVHVALNPRLTAALTGRTAQDTRLSAAELKALGPSYAARVLHQRLCALINDGTSRTLRVSTLLEYLFPDDVSAQTLATLRRRTARGDAAAAVRQQTALQDALNVLQDKLGWSCKEFYGRDESRFEIKRPMQDWTYHAQVVEG